jgi:hypothetical protein
MRYDDAEKALIENAKALVHHAPRGLDTADIEAEIERRNVELDILLDPDKYRGRVDALVATRDTPDVSAALLKGGFARSYDGGRRDPWC